MGGFDEITGVLGIGIVALAMAGAVERSTASGAEIATIDRLVSHLSTVPAIAGKPMDLFVREKVIASVVEASDGKARPGSVVLFVHGGYSPSTLAFDVPYRDYSWMEYLARAG